MNTNNANAEWEDVEFVLFEFFKFNLDNKNIFEGKYLRMNSGEKDGKKWESPVFLHADGKEYGLPAHMQIMNAVKQKGVGNYRIEYLRDEAIENGKTQSIYKIQFRK